MQMDYPVSIPSAGWNFPFPLQVAGADTEIKTGAFGGLCIHHGLIVAASVETEDYLIEHSSVVRRHATSA